MMKSTSSATATTRIRRTCELPPRPRRPARRATAPRRRRGLGSNQIDGTIPTEIGKLTALSRLRVPPAPPTPGAPRDRPSASQVPQRQRDQRHAPRRVRPAHEPEVPASPPRVPDARRAARPRLGVTGGSTTTISPARSLSPSATSRIASPRIILSSSGPRRATTTTTSSRRASGRFAAISSEKTGRLAPTRPRPRASPRSPRPSPASSCSPRRPHEARTELRSAPRPPDLIVSPAGLDRRGARRCQVFAGPVRRGATGLIIRRLLPPLRGVRQGVVEAQGVVVRLVVDASGFD